jgi:5-methylthioadenosine/S-adenosylhomocysteine deaminase
MKTKIQGGYVVAYNGKQHEVLDGGCVVFEGPNIIFVGFPDNPACPKTERTLHAPGRLISPGFINLHCIANIDLQPLRIDVGSVGFPKSKAWFEADTLLWNEEEYRTSATFAVATLLRHGSTTFCNVTTMASKRYDDPEIEPKALAEASQQLGARAYLAHNFQDYSRYNPIDDKTESVYNREAGQKGLQRALKLVEYLRSLKDERIQPFLFPYTTETCSDDLLKEATQAARALHVPIRSHFAQYTYEAKKLLSEQGISPVERLAKLGALGSDLTLTHAIFLRGHPEVGGGDIETDLKLLADSSTHVAHCPVVFSRRGELLRSFQRYLNAGINLALGTDTAPPDMIGEMRMASTMSKVADNNPESGSAADVFNAATLGGAKALGRDDLGKLAVGAKADIAVFNLSTLHIGVIDDPIKALVHYANGADTETVIIDGKIVVEAGRVVGLAEDTFLHQAQQTWDVYKKALVARDPKGRTADELYPPAFPIRNARQQQS